MDEAGGTRGLSQEVDVTLRWVTVAFRVMAVVWSLALIAGLLASGAPGSRTVVGAAAVAGVAWAGLTVWVSRTGHLGRVWFAIADGAFIFAISAAGYLAGADDFISGGYPASWLFVVAYVADLRWTMAASVALLLEHVLIHDLMNLGVARTIGTFQFLVFGLSSDGHSRRCGIRNGAGSTPRLDWRRNVVRRSGTSRGPSSVNSSTTRCYRRSRRSRPRRTIPSRSAIWPDGRNVTCDERSRSSAPPTSGASEWNS